MIITNAHFKYAKALFNTSKKLQKSELVLEDLKILNDCFKNNEFKSNFKKLTFLKLADLYKIIDALFKEKIQQITLNLLLILAKNKKLFLISRIYKIYCEYYYKEKNVTQLIIRTSRKLDDDEQVKLIEKFVQILDKKVAVEFEQDSKLIGGMQILEQGFLTDYSIKNHLEILRQKLVESK